MKNRLVFLLIATAMLLTFTACQKPEDPQNTPATANETTVATATNNAQTTAPVSTTVPTTTTTEATTTTTQATVVTPDEPIVFTSDDLHFSLTMPASWDGAFAHRTDGNSVSFYELTNNQYDAHSGHLFTIRFMSKEIDIEFPSYKLLGTYGDYNVIAMFPTDVQFNFDDKAMADKYIAMSEEVNGVIETFAYFG